MTRRRARACVRELEEELAAIGADRVADVIGAGPRGHGLAARGLARRV